MRHRPLGSRPPRNVLRVDIAEEMIAVAESHAPGGEYRVLENGRIPYPDDAYDLVCSIAVRHHNAYRDQERVLTELLLVLRPDGPADRPRRSGDR